MEFGVDEYVSMHLVRESVLRSDNSCISVSVSFRILDEGKSYKYLGMSEALGIDEQNINN